MLKIKKKRGKDLEAINIEPGMQLHIIPSEKFTTNIICVLIRRPLSRDEVTMNALLSNILQRGSTKYKTISEINLATEKMYGSLFETQIIKKGEQHILQFFLECINDDLTLLAEGLHFLYEVILQPLTECEGFHPDYVNGEK